MNTETVEIKLPAALIAELNKVARLAGVKVETVIRVALAAEAVRMARIQEG